MTARCPVDQTHTRQFWDVNSATSGGWVTPCCSDSDWRAQHTSNHLLFPLNKRPPCIIGDFLTRTQITMMDDWPPGHIYQGRGIDHPLIIQGPDRPSDFFLLLSLLVGSPGKSDGTECRLQLCLTMFHQANSFMVDI